jgi:ribosomal protein S27AE
MHSNIPSIQNKRSSRPKQRNTDTLKIDMRDILSHGFRYDRAMNGTLSINCDDKAICVITTNAMNLIYHLHVNEHWKYLKQKITLDWMFQDDNSQNAYSICPECGKRTLVLHHRGKSFACRKCSQLTIMSNCSQYKFTPYAA